MEEVLSNDPFTAAPKFDFPLPAGEAKEVNEVASTDPFTAAVELSYPLPAEEANELEEVASNEPFSATAELEYSLTAEQPKEVEESPAELTKEVEEATAEVIKEVEEATAEVRKEVEEAPAYVTKELEEAPAQLTVEVEEPLAEQPKLVARSSRAKKNLGGSLQKKTRVRKVLSGAEKNKNSTKYEDDPFVGKTVAFGRNSTVGSSLVHHLGNKFDESGICYDLDNSDGHIVGTVLRKNRIKRRVSLPAGKAGSGG